jgi:cytochrome c oxidase subunit I
MWPRITGKPLASKALARAQLWLWFGGMLVTTLPWHIAGLMGQPRRVATFDYTDPLMARMAPLVVISVIGGAILLLSAILLIVILVRSHFGVTTRTEPMRYALAVNPPRQVPPALNGFGLWNAILAVLMVAAYGYPIGQVFFLGSHGTPTVEVTSPSISGGQQP